MPPKKKEESQAAPEEVSVTPKQTTPIPEYKTLWVEMKKDPEIGFLLNQEGYPKTQVVLLYKILKLLERLEKK